MSGMEQAPTRSAVLELKGERVVVGEAYDFLDEKRLLLAAEILRPLEEHDRLQRELGVLVEPEGRPGAAQHPVHGGRPGQDQIGHRLALGEVPALRLVELFELGA